jgi:hypothetical protein
MKVIISGTIGKDKRPDFGLDDIGDKVNSNRLNRVVVVGIMEYHGHHELVGRPESVSMAFVALEPVGEEDDHGVRLLIDKYRKARGIGPTELTLFDAAEVDEKGPWPGDADFDPDKAKKSTKAAADKAAE